MIRMGKSIRHKWVNSESFENLTRPYYASPPWRLHLALMYDNDLPFCGKCFEREGWIKSYVSYLFS